MGIHMKNNINYTGATSLNSLRDVVIDSPATGQGIVWNEEKQQWTNGEVSTNDMVEITLAEYEALSTEEKNNDTTYFITDAENVDLGSVGTAGTLKPWLYDSDEEVVIGVYDGKPLYRKTLVYENYMVSTGRNELSFEIDNIDMIVNSYGCITNSIHTSVRPINTHITDSTGDSLYYVIYFTDKYIHLQANDTWSSPNIYFTIEYTKTTDAENSGINLMPYSFVQNGGGCNYSTEEQVIGKWIDGKPLYQKTVYYLNTQSSFSDYVTIEEIVNIDMPIKLEFVVKRGTGENIIYMTGNGSTIPESNLNYGVKARILAKNLQYRIDTYGIEISDMWFTIQYTKTTD